MKKILSLILSLSLFLTMGFPITAKESTSQPDIVINGITEEIPDYIIQDIIQNNPDAGQITIYEYKDFTDTPVIQPFYVTFSDVKKTYTGYNIQAKDLFVTSVAKGQVRTLGVQWSGTLSCSITGGIDQSALGISGSVTKTYYASDVFTGPSNDEPFNSREFRVVFFENQGTYTSTCHDTIAGFVLKYPVNGTFNEPIKYLAYSIDRSIQ